MRGKRRGGKGRRGSARQILSEKIVDTDGGITELVIWEVPGSTHSPEGIKYRCAYIPPGEEQPSVLYDVHRGKSHHRHVEGVERSYKFKNVSELVNDFVTDVERIKAQKGR